MGYLTGLRKVHEFDLCLFLAYVACVWVFKLEVYPLPQGFTIGLRENLLIFWVGVASIFINVIPKYLGKTGANRHFNDQTQKKFLSRNYVRLLVHILGGGFSFLFSGYTLWNYHYGLQSYSLLTIKCIAIFLDFVHETSIIVMIRNSDGIMALRSNNAFFAVIKAYYCMKLWHAPTMDASIPFISAIFVYTSGFMTTRVYSALIVFAQLGLGMTMKTMAENWYSCGEFLAQFLIISRTGAGPLANLLFPFFCYHFRHELWTKKNGLRNRTLALAPVVVGIFVATQLQLDELLQNNLFHMDVHILLGVYSFFFAGQYFKRQPVLGLDYGKKKAKKASVEDLQMRGAGSDKLDAPTSLKRTETADMRDLAAGWVRMSYYASWKDSDVPEIDELSLESECDSEKLAPLLAQALPSIKSIRNSKRSILKRADSPRPDIVEKFFTKKTVSFRRTIR